LWQGGLDKAWSWSRMTNMTKIELRSVYKAGGEEEEESKEGQSEPPCHLPAAKELWITVTAGL